MKLYKISFLCLMYSVFHCSLIGQTINLSNKKETKTVELEISRIVEIELNGRQRYKGQAIATSDSTLSMQTKVKSKRNKIDTLVTVSLSDITEIVYCTKKEESKCKPEKMLYVPIVFYTSLIAELVIMDLDLNSNLIFIPLSAMIISNVVYLTTKPRTYNLVLRWKVVY